MTAARSIRWTALCGALAFSACSSSGSGSTTGSGGTTGVKTSSGAGAGSSGTGKTSSNGGTTGHSVGGGSTGGHGATASGTSGAGHSSAGGSSGAAASTSAGGNSTTGAAASSSAGGASTASGGGSTGGVASTSSSGGTGASYGVVERGGGPMRNAVFQDPAFIEGVVSDGGLQVDATFSNGNAAWNGPVFSQPLYLYDGATSQAMIIVTTDSNEIYAVDPASGNTIWSDAPGTANAIAAAIPDPAGNYMGAGQGCAGSISPYGISGTPVIDPIARVMYLDAATVVSGAAHHLVYAINLDDGTTVSGWPIDLDGLPMTLGNGGTGTFQSFIENERGSLTLLGGVLYIPFGGLDGDCGEYSGAIAAVPVASPSSVAIWATSAPSGSGIWGPSGVASDGTSVFVSTGNTNSFQRPSMWNNANSEAVVRLSAGTPPVFSGSGSDYFAPSDQACNWLCDDDEDADLGSSGVVLFDYPGSSAHPHLAFAIGKTANAYLLDRTALGGISLGLSGIPGAPGGSVFGSMAAYTTPTATYVVTPSNGTQNFNVSGDPPQLGAGWQNGSGGYGSPIVSTSDGAQDYMVWVTGGNLTALDGDTGNQVARIAIPNGEGAYTHWVTPIIAQGALYLAGNNQLMKFDP